MALSVLSRGCKHHVFPSFHGEDVRRGLLGCLLKEFKEKGIDVFIDNDIERNRSIGPELITAIRGSIIAIVLISKNYASSTWCLNELVEIMKCRKEQIQTTMVVFYEVEPTHVKKQFGYFGDVFNKTCTGKTEKEVEIWKQALQEVAQIAGYNSLKWDNDALIAERIATDISNMLNDSIASNDYEGLVGVENHIEKIESLLSLDSDEVRMVGIWGPAGIGKTTIARALHKKLKSQFTHTAFIESINGKFEQNYQDEHAFMLYLQEQLLSQTLKQKDMKIGHLGVAKARLKYKQVLVVLDDVHELIQLEAMSNKTCWFGPKSRIIITTKDKQLLKAHDIDYVYNVDYPSQSEALEILCQSAFRQNSPPFGFEDMAIEVTYLAGNLPLGLSVFGAYLRGMSKDEWTHALPRLRTSLDGKIEKVLRFSYDALCDKDQELFLNIACFFKGERISDVVECVESRLNVNHGLKVLFDKSFVSTHERGLLLVHNLLEQLGKEIVRKQSDNPGKRQFLVDAQEIFDVLSDNIGTESIRGIDLDLSEIREDIIVDEEAFEGMSRLQFIRFKRPWYLDSKDKLVLPQGLKFRGNKLRLLQWDECPMTMLPREFHPRFLVKLGMRNSKLEKLWEEAIPLPCLKKIDLYGSSNLKYLPNLSKATNLEVILAAFCTSLVEIPSTIGNAINIKTLNLGMCESLVVLPSSIWSLKKLSELGIVGCSKLKHLGSQLITSSYDVSANITEFNMSNTKIEEFPSSIIAFSHLRKLSTGYGKSLKVFPNVPESIEELELNNTGIEEMPSSIQNLSNLTKLSMQGCEKLKILPRNINMVSLKYLDLSFCTQLKTFPEISTSIVKLNMRNTAIEEVPSSIWFWLRLVELNLQDCKSLFNVGLQELKLNGVSATLRAGRRLRINLSGCINLVSLPHLPDFVTFLDAAGCELLARVDGFSTNPDTCLNFSNCFNLSQEAKELISNCKRALLPGKELPGYFDHKAKGDFLKINLEDQRPRPLFLRFKACILLLPYTKEMVGHSIYDKYENLSCCVWGVDNGVDVGFGSSKYHLPALLGLEEHLYFLESSISTKTDVDWSELDFQFKITGQYWRIGECGVTFLDNVYKCFGSIHNEAEYKESADIMITKLILCTQEQS